MDDKRIELPQGTLDLLILTTLRRGPQHGYGIAAHIATISNDVLRVEEGSLYPALHRMEQVGWIVAEWQVTANNRRARYYELTAAGRRQLAIEHAAWKRAFMAVNWIMQANVVGGEA